MQLDLTLSELIKAENWGLVKVNGVLRIKAFDTEYPLTHPVQIHLKRYREEKIPEIKYHHMKAAHDYLWPKDVRSWHYWTEDRFKEHCAGWNYMSWAGCANSAKSYDAAKLLILFWLANPEHRAVMVASTTLTAMGRRVWGYTTKLLNKMAVRVPYQYTAGNSPQILYPRDDRAKAKDTLHGIFCAAAKQGNDETAISNFIGTHPDEAMLLVLDESTDLPVAILNSVANLNSSEKPFQVIAIGNSSDTYDLHGALSTPKNGWNSIDPHRDVKWETTQRRGVCLYFNAYNSPAIHETDAERKAILSTFLATERTVKEAEQTHGADSVNFWRFTLGYWRPSSVSSTMMSKEFVDPLRLYERAHWSGADNLICVGGLDPAFSTGGDSCILRLGYLGQTVDGDVVLDLRNNDLLFRIEISATSPDAAEIQISKQVAIIMGRHGCALHNLVVDATGQGRALGGTLQLYMQSHRPPLKIYSTRAGNQRDKSFDVIPKTRHELWFDMRRFIEARSLRGVDNMSLAQITSRLVLLNEKTGKQELESKSDYKKRMGAVMPTLAHSPDEADGLSLCLQSAILNYGFFPGQKRQVEKVAPGVMQEIAAWKNNVRMVQENHLTGAGDRGFPKADFGSGEVSKWAKL